MRISPPFPSARRVLGVLAILLLTTLMAAVPTRAGEVGVSVVGGSRDTRTDVGWVAALMEHPDTASGTGQDRQFCGGSLVRARWVLTAAHCVTGSQGNSVPARTLQVLLGQKDLNADVSVSGGELHDVVRILVYRRFNSDWDAALLELETASQELPVRLARSRPRAGTPAYVAGWGDRRPSTDPEAEYPRHLRSAFVPIRKDAECSASSDEFFAPAQFCAGTDRGKPDTCSGDSGGPLAVDRDNGGPTRWRLVGVTSYGDCGIPGEYGFYTRLTAPALREWIVDNTSNG